MKNLLLSYWLWTALLIGFVAIILWDDKLDKTTAGYFKHRMVLKNVNFSQIDGGFEQARLYADICDMDDNQNNMNASNVRTIFFKQDQATWTGKLLAERALKNPFEAKFWGDVRGWNTDNERIRTDELRYYFNRKELHTQMPVTIWKDDAVLTGLGLRYSTVDKEAQINQQVVIRIWETASNTTKVGSEPELVLGLPVAPPLSQILLPLNQQKPLPAADLVTSDSIELTTAIITTDPATHSANPTKEPQP